MVEGSKEKECTEVPSKVPGIKKKPVLQASECEERNRDGDDGSIEC